MISMQQLEELENRIVKALQLINDLRSENAKYENENESLRGEVEEVKLSLEEKEQEIQRIKKELDNATRELREIKEREEVLEKKVIGLLGKLDILQSGTIPPGYQFKETPVSTETRKVPSEPSTVKTGIVSDIPVTDRPEIKSSSSFASGQEKSTAPVSESGKSMKIDEVTVETVDTTETIDSDEDDIIIIDDESGLDEDDIILETHGESKAGDDEIILLDDEDDEIVIDDLDDDTVIVDEQDVPKGKATKEPVKDARTKDAKTKKTPKDDDDEFLIIEDEDK